jgi:hypothetical protein
MSRPYHIYITKQDRFRVYDSVTKIISNMDKLPSPKTGYSQFHVLKGYNSTDEGIIQFAADFKQWVSELKTSKVLKVYYDKYYNHNDAVTNTFKRLAKDLYEHHEPINPVEKKWMDSCYNAGIMYCSPGEYNSYGYDFSLFYPSILASPEFKIPIRKGSEACLKKLNDNPEKFSIGYYRVQIVCADPNFRKIFAFSKNHVYTQISLQQAFKYQSQFNVKIDLIQDGKPNAYIYESRLERTKDVTTGQNVFGKWYQTLIALRAEFPKNKLVKELATSLWGRLSSYTVRNLTLQQIEEQDIDLGGRYKVADLIIKADGDDYYKVRDTENPYNFNIRLKPFLTAIGRNKISEVVMHDIENCIRIYTDNATFSQKQYFTNQKFDLLTMEKKTSGYICWENAQSYNHDDFISDSEFEMICQT